MNIKVAFALGVTTLALSGCAHQLVISDETLKSFVPGKTSCASILDQLGAPSNQTSTPDGRILSFGRGFAGSGSAQRVTISCDKNDMFQTYMANNGLAY